MTRIDKVDDDWLIQSGVKPGDVAVSDILKHGGGTIWVFRKLSGRWKQITTWGEIY